MLNMYCTLNFIDHTKVHYNDINIRKLLEIFIESKGTSSKLENYLNKNWENKEIIVRKFNILSKVNEWLKFSK